MCVKNRLRFFRCVACSLAVAAASDATTRQVLNTNRRRRHGRNERGNHVRPRLGSGTRRRVPRERPRSRGSGAAWRSTSTSAPSANALADARQLDDCLSNLFVSAHPAPALEDRAVSRLRAAPTGWKWTPREVGGSPPRRCCYWASARSPARWSRTTCRASKACLLRPAGLLKVAYAQSRRGKAVEPEDKNLTRGRAPGPDPFANLEARCRRSTGSDKAKVAEPP